MIVFRHWIYPLARSGKPYPLSCNQLSRRFGLPLLVDRHSKSHKESPAGFQPFDQKNQKCVFNNASPWLATEHRHLDGRAFPGCRMKRRIENFLIAPEFSVGTPRGKEFDRLLRAILNAPSEQPATAPDFPISTKLPDSDLGSSATHSCHVQ